MHRNSATKPLEKVPRHTHLFRRGARYYFRLGVPQPLRPILGRREIVKSLETADYGLAVERVSVEERTARDILGAARRKLEIGERTAGKPVKPEPLIVTSEQHARELARQWFVEIEKSGARWWGENRRALEREERTELLADLGRSQAAITGDGEIHPTDRNDGSGEVRAFLRLHNKTLDERGESFALLARYFAEARLEQARRQTDRINGEPIRPYETLFGDLDEHATVAPIRKGISIGQLCGQVLTDFAKAKLAPKTLLQYGVTARLLGEVFGNDRDAATVTSADVEGFATILETMPESCAKRYAGKSVAEAITLARKRGDHSRLAPNTRRNRFFAARAIFKRGVETKKLPENPFDDALMRARFRPSPNEVANQKRRESFTLDQLRKIFAAPLFTGCKDDEHGYAKPGPSVIRRGRFFVPLIALFQGMRQNEICQLFTSDIGEWAGGLSIAIRPDGDKRLKNKASERTIPIHPELLKMGFREYVAARRLDKDSLRLFPELGMAKSGSYADKFSKWFVRFLRHVFGDDGQKVTETCFHSFRHSFKDACEEADLSYERVGQIGGWSYGNRTQREYGSGKKLAALAEDLAKVRYRGLDLRHLYTGSVQPGAPKAACRNRTRRK